MQTLSPCPPRCHEDEEELDLNKAFDVQCFQQILHPGASSPPENRRVYDEQDFEGQTHTAGLSGGFWIWSGCSSDENDSYFCSDHRHSSLHVHHPLSKSRRTNEGKKEWGRGSDPNPVNTIEEDWEEEGGEEDADGEERRLSTPSR